MTDWGSLPLQLKQNTAYAFGRDAETELGVPLSACEEHWASWGLLRKTYTNNVGHQKRKQAAR